MPVRWILLQKAATLKDKQYCFKLIAPNSIYGLINYSLYLFLIYFKCINCSFHLSPPPPSPHTTMSWSDWQVSGVQRCVSTTSLTTWLAETVNRLRTLLLQKFCVIDCPFTVTVWLVIIVTTCSGAIFAFYRQIFSANVLF